MNAEIDIALLKKYDRPGPRYTSYPTAPVFATDFTSQDYLREIARTNGPDSDADVSLYFHFPFCDTLCYFCGCTMLVTQDRGRIEEYLRYLKKEIDMIAPMIAPHRRVTQIHWGGGTPTHLAPDQILDIAEYIKNSFPVSPDVEMSVEIDPRELTQKHLGTLRHVGFNRMSMGVQDFNPEVQKAVNRVQPEEMTYEVLKWATALEFESINIDLMYGLPFQTEGTFAETLHEVLKFQPDRIAVFNYAHVPWLKPHQKLIRTEDLPSPDVKLRMLKSTIEFLGKHGYEYIGMDHFAKPTDELARAQKEHSLYRNFQGYSTRSGADLFGFGMSAIGHFGSVYAQNAKVLPEYYTAIEAGQPATRAGYVMTEDDRIRKHVIMRLMCDLEISKRSVEQLFGISFNAYFAKALDELSRMEADGLVILSEESIRVVGSGRLLLRNIAMCFDAYLDKIGEGKPIFSRTV
jgi:oxygen-independent coproporphyrinogen III oxidase